MKEEYVTYFQAVKLKELGFKCVVYTHYPQGDNNIRYTEDAINWNNSVALISAPRLDQAQKWLRDKGIHVSANPYCKVYNHNICDAEDCAWSSELYSVPFGRWLNVSKGEFDTYELALSAGIDAALELLTLNTK